MNQVARDRALKKRVDKALEEDPSDSSLSSDEQFMKTVRDFVGDSMDDFFKNVEMKTGKANKGQN